MSPNRSRIVRTMLAVSVLAGAAGSCRDEEQGLPFPEQARLACMQIQRKLAAIPSPASTAAPDIDAYITRTLDVNREGVAKLRGLDPGPAETAAYERLISASQAATEGFEEFAAAFRAEDEGAQQKAIDTIAAARERYAAAVRDLEIPSCLPPSATPAPS